MSQEILNTRHGFECVLAGIAAIRDGLDELVFLKRQELKIREQELELTTRLLKLQELR